MLSKFSVKKPYTVVVGVVLVIILGVVSFTKMTVDLFQYEPALRDRDDNLSGRESAGGRGDRNKACGADDGHGQQY